MGTYSAVFRFFSNKVIDNSSLNKWFKDASIAQHGNDVGALWPDEIFFFDNERTLSLQETTTPDKRGNYFYQLICPSNGTDYKALQLSLLVGILVSICESEDQNQKGKFSEFNIDRLINSNDVIAGPEKFSPGEGLWIE